jgi:hypothetical protein
MFPVKGYQALKPQLDTKGGIFCELILLIPKNKITNNAKILTLISEILIHYKVDE